MYGLLDRDIKYIIKALEQHDEIEKAIIFGSRAMGNYKKGSDVDIAIIGENVTLYQGVTLGGTGKEKGKRHPTIGNNVMIGAGAKVLGSFTIGDNSKVAAGSVVLEEVPPNCTVVGVPGIVVKQDNVPVQHNDLDQVHIPHPVQNELKRLNDEIEKLKNK